MNSNKVRNNFLKIKQYLFFIFNKKAQQSKCRIS